MTLWDTLNSPFILTVVSVVSGGILASAISAVWQRRSQRHSLRLALVQEILTTYHEYIRYLRRDTNIDNSEEFDQLHAKMLSGSRMAKVLFNEEIAIQLDLLANKLANIQDLRVKANSSGRQKLKRAVENLRIEAFKESASAIEKMFEMLK